ncbi:MAG: D-alanyl-D-alanine endopeptidase [Pseudomonadota bacterium]|jgi:D-alanyl-D-alanine endopeptidase (penicillin-binding protein 7)
MYKNSAAVAFSLIGAFALGAGSSLAASRPDVKSPSVVVLSWDHGKILYERNADEVRPIASLSKMFAAMVLHDECKLGWNTLHQMTEENREAARGGDFSKLRTGWRFTLDDLMHAALMRSDNRAFPAMAEACGMSPTVLGERMTSRARELGLMKTVFAEPTGLSPNNVSTAHEVALMLQEVTKRPRLQNIMAKRSHWMTAHLPSGRKMRYEIRNTDRLLQSRDFSVISGKTGFTNLARYCLAVALRTVEHGDLGMVLMGAEGKLTRFADVRRIYQWLKKSNTVAALNPAGRAKQSSEGQDENIPVKDTSL